MIRHGIARRMVLVLFCTGIGVLFVFGGPFLFVRVFVRDISPVDDSFMRRTQTAIHEDQNAWPVLLQSIAGLHKHQMENLTKESELCDKFVTNDPERLDALKRKYYKRIQIMDKAASIPFAQTPQNTEINEPMPYIMPIRDLCVIRMCISEYDLRKGRIAEATRESP
jgi:hypothetical protein